MKKEERLVIVPNPMKSPFLHDLSAKQKIVRDMENKKKSLHFKKRISKVSQRKK